MPELFFQPLDNWELARQGAKKMVSAPVAIDIFAGKTYVEKAIVADLLMERLTVLPLGCKAVPESIAVVLNKIDWQIQEKLLSDLNLHWQQTNDSCFDLTFSLSPGARCYGLGERYSGLNLRGRVHTLFTSDDSRHIESIDMMYKAIPFLIIDDPLAPPGSRFRGLFLDSTARQKWSLDPDGDNTARIEVLTRLPWQIYMFAGQTLPELLAAFTLLTGRSQLPPRWSLGHQQSRWSYPDEATIRSLAVEFRERRIPCDTIVLDIDYMDEYRVFTNSKERFPDLKQLVADLAELNFKVVTIVDPAVKKDPGYSVYKEGIAGKYFCETADGQIFIGKVWPGASTLPDFANEATRAWWGEKHRFYTDMGIAGIWNDMNEPALFDNQTPLAIDARALPAAEPFFHKQDKEQVGHLELRNAYGSLMCRATHEGLKKLRPHERPFVLTRSCYAGIQRYAAVWLGDNMSWWEHLAGSVPMLLNMGLSGVPFAGVDIGGFGGDTTAELLLRWYQVGIFYPFFRNHAALDTRAQEPWAFGPEVEANIRHLIETRYKLLPYIEQLFCEHRETGAPLMRPLSWLFADDPVACEIDDQFLLGNNILVAPILKRGKSSRFVYLPVGLWFPYEGGEPLSGGKIHHVSWPLGTVPAFVREGSILPLYDDPVQSTVECDKAAVTFMCFGDHCQGIYYEDDGISNNYLQGQYNQWQLSYSAGKLESRAIHKGMSVNHKRRYGFVSVNGAGVCTLSLD